MRNIMVSYYRINSEFPTDAGDLINYLESESDFLSDDVFKLPYEFLKKNRDKIIIVQLKLREILDTEALMKLENSDERGALEDEYTCMFFKNTKIKNLIGSISWHDSLSVPEKMLAD